MSRLGRLSPSALHDPFLMKGMGLAIERIERRRDNERILPDGLA